MILPTNIVPVLEKELKELNTVIGCEYMLDVVQAYVECNTEMLRDTVDYGPRCDE